jgi:hypothetical protein
MVVLVDEDKQEFIVTDRANEHDAIFPKPINFNEFFKLKRSEFEQHTDNLLAQLKELKKYLRIHDPYKIEVRIENVIKFLYGNDEYLFNEIKNDYQLDQLKSFITVIKRFIEEYNKIKKLEIKVKYLYPDINIDFYVSNIKILYNVFSDISNNLLGSVGIQTKTDDDVQNYIDNTIKIREIITNGIEPVDIMDNYSAGWLSPQGDYYALNGDIANMLHNEIADALQAKGIIPKTDDEGDEINNPDSWLEQHGWVKIHGCNVQFAGCLNHKFGLENVHMTDIQKKMIYEYAAILHGGMVKAGWRRLPVSAIRFRETDDLMLAKNYFNYD